MQIQRHISQEPCLSIQLPKEGALQNTMYKNTEIQYIDLYSNIKVKSDGGFTYNVWQTNIQIHMYKNTIKE